MIAVAIAATEAVPIAPPNLAPPIGLSIPYRTVTMRPDPRGGTIRLSLDERLRFDMTGDGLEVSATADGATVDAPAAIRPIYQALFAGSEGTRTRGHVDRHGQVVSIVDGAASWAAVRASQAAALARLDADPSIPAADKDRARLLSARMFDLDPAARDARLADALADLLPPAVPPLRPGEARQFTSTIGGPAGPMAASGTIALVDAEAGLLRFRIDTIADPASAERAATALLAAIEPGQAPDQRVRREADAAAMRDLTYGETLEAVVERATGLLVRSRLIRQTTDKQGRQAVLEDMSVTRISSTVP